MRAVILAAGKGSRLGSLTETTPKPLLTIGGNRSILANIVDNCINVGIREISIVVGYAAPMIESWLSRQALPGTVRVVTTTVSHFDTTNALSLLEGLEHGPEVPTLIHNGDTFTRPEAIQHLLPIQGGVVLAVDRSAVLTEESMKVTTSGPTVSRISKDIRASDADAEYIGVATVSADALPLVVRELKAAVQKPETRFYEDAFDAIASSSQVVLQRQIPAGPWIEIDTEDDLTLARALFA